MIKRAFPVVCMMALAASHVVLCLRYLANTHYVGLRGNEFALFNAAWHLMRYPAPFLEMNGFPIFPLTTYAFFLRMLPNTAPVFAMTAAEITVSTMAILVLFQLCRALEFNPYWASVACLFTVVQPENVHLGSTTSFNDNFFYFSALLAAWGWLKYRSGRGLRWLYLAVSGCVLATMSRWEGFMMPPILAVLLWRGVRDERPRSAVEWWSRFIAPLALSVSYDIAIYVHAYVFKRWETPLAFQLQGYAPAFGAGELSPLSYYWRSLSWFPQNVALVAVSLLTVAWQMTKASPRTPSERRIWSEYWLFPVGILLAYLFFVSMRLGTPKMHIWSGIILCVPLFFWPLSRAADASRRWRLLACLLGLLPIALCAGRLRPYLTDSRAINMISSDAPRLESLDALGFYVRSLWVTGVLKPDETMLVELWKQSSPDEDGQKRDLHDLVIFVSPERILLDRDSYGPPNKDSEVFVLPKPQMLRYFREHRVRAVVAQTPQVERLLRDLATPLKSVGPYTVYLLRQG